VTFRAPLTTSAFAPRQFGLGAFERAAKLRDAGFGLPELLAGEVNIDRGGFNNRATRRRFPTIGKPEGKQTVGIRQTQKVEKHLAAEFSPKENQPQNSVTYVYNHPPNVLSANKS
jgi:hypothetical protein